MRRVVAASIVTVVFIAALPLIVGAATPADLRASAGTYYVTQINFGAIAKVVVDGAGNVSVTDKFVTGLSTEGPDSAVFANDGTLIVSNFGAGTISRVDVNTRKIVTPVINTTMLDSAADLAIDPNGNAVWAIERGGSGPLALARIDLGNGATSPMNPDGIESPGGITFNGDGSRLFVSSGGGTVYELDPHSGHVVRKVDVNGSPDGMTFDPSNGNVFASGCGGICVLDTGGNGGQTLRYLRTLKSGDGDGIAADGHGHIYVAEASCGDLCRIDISADSAVTVAQSLNGADDVTPLVGAGSAGGGACLNLASCYGGPVTAGIAAASVALFLFVGASGFAGGTPPVPATAAGGHATAATHAAHASAGGHLAAGPPAVDTPSLTGRVQEEAGEKLLEVAGAGVEEGMAIALPEAEAAAEAELPAPPPVEPPPPPPNDVPPPPPPEDAPPPPPPPGADAGASRMARDDEEPDRRER
ncbi:MAG: hypothetical protein ABR498_05975 [Candidatus Dormibacteria bacterium]